MCACLIAFSSVCASGAAHFEFLYQCEEMLVSTLVALHFYTESSELHLQQIAKMTHLTSLIFERSTRNLPSAGTNLTILQSLAKLHTFHLSGCQYAYLDLTRLQSLRKLSLSCHGDTYDVTSCTQITSLEVTWSSSGPQSLFLPIGSRVQLQHLSISALYDAGCFHNLHHLQDATHLTSVQFHRTYDWNLVWPVSMPHLEIVEADSMPGPPQQLLAYCHLRHLDISCYIGSRAPVALPSWFSRLTQLNSLHVYPGLSVFPVCLLRLRQLSSLDLGLSCKRCDCIELPVEIVHFSQFPALTNLSMRSSKSVYSHGFSTRALQQLSSLDTLLGPGVLRFS